MTDVSYGTQRTVKIVALGNGSNPMTVDAVDAIDRKYSLMREAGEVGDYLVVEWSKGNQADYWRPVFNASDKPDEPTLNL